MAARAEEHGGHDCAVGCSDGGSDSLRVRRREKGKGPGEGENERELRGGSRQRADEDGQGPKLAGGGSPWRHVRHASARRQRLKTLVPLAGWADF